jgi:hypothetical protein
MFKILSTYICWKNIWNATVGGYRHVHPILKINRHVATFRRDVLRLSSEKIWRILLCTLNKTSNLTGVKSVPEIPYTYRGLPTTTQMNHVTHSAVATRGLTNWSYLSLHGVIISCISLPAFYLYLTEGGKPETRDPDPSLRCTQWRIDTWRTWSPSSAGGNKRWRHFLRGLTH